MNNLVIVLLVIILLNACTTVTTQDSRVPVEDRSIETDISPETIVDESHPQEQDTSSDNLTGPEAGGTVHAEKQPENKATTTDKTNTSPAVLALLDDAESYTGAGKQEYAVAQLERGIRIEPNNPILWNKLAQLRLEQEKWSLAVSLAQKSNALSYGNHVLQAKNWQIIALARQALGDKQGANEAYAKSRSLISGGAE